MNYTNPQIYSHKKKKKIIIIKIKKLILQTIKTRKNKIDITKNYQIINILMANLILKMQLILKFAYFQYFLKDWQLLRKKFLNNI